MDTHLRFEDAGRQPCLSDPSAPAAIVFDSRSPEHFAACLCRASDKCQREKRKTINGDDLLWAMSTLGFEDYIEPLKLYLHKYREVQRQCGTQDHVMFRADGWQLRLRSCQGSWPWGG